MEITTLPTHTLVSRAASRLLASCPNEDSSSALYLLPGRSSPSSFNVCYCPTHLSSSLVVTSVFSSQSSSLHFWGTLLLSKWHYQVVGVIIGYGPASITRRKTSLWTTRSTLSSRLSHPRGGGGRRRRWGWISDWQLVCDRLIFSISDLQYPPP